MGLVEVVWCGVVWCWVCDVATVTGTGTGAGVDWCGDVAVLSWPC